MATNTKKTSAIVLAVLVVVAGVAVGVVALVSHGKAPANAASAAAPVRTTTVQKTDLSNSQSFNGTLGYGIAQTVKGTGQGVVTKLPKSGDLAARGDALYWVNDQPVPVFFGDTPLFRKLDAAGIHGADVATVADNLAALGDQSGTRAQDPQKATWTPALSAALKRWQAKAGLNPTGTLDVGQVLVVAGPVRVNAVQAQLGDPVAGALMSVTSTAKVVTMPVQATEVGKIKTGSAVTVIRPDNKQVPAKVTAISTTVDSGTLTGSSGQAAQTGSPPKLNVTVTPDNMQDVADLDAASVQVQITTESRPGVLAVPIGALVALREGGYAVELPGGQLKAVQTGMFSQQLVEISGPGIVAGLQVVTTS